MTYAALKEHSGFGIQPLDKDHDELGERLGALSDALYKESFSASKFNEALDGLLEHVKEHFNREEAWMKSENYPALRTHKKQHDNLVQAIEELRGTFSSAPSRDTGRTFFGFVENWLVDHTFNADRVIGGYFNYRRIVSFNYGKMVS